MSNALIRPTDSEDAAITAAAASDPDNPPLDEPILAKKWSRVEQHDHTWKFISIRVHRDVLAAFKANEPGWQKRINEVLKDWADKTK